MNILIYIEVVWFKLLWCVCKLSYDNDSEKNEYLKEKKLLQCMAKQKYLVG